MTESTGTQQQNTVHNQPGKIEGKKNEANEYPAASLHT